MTISNELKKRFCKDTGIPINIYEEPYFTSRLKLFDSTYNCIKKYNQFIEEINTFKNEQDYFEYYNSVKDNAINAIKESEGYKSFQNEDMNKFAIKNQGYNQKDIYKSFNIEKYFISIDIKKANFSALYAYDKSIFNGANTYEEFISQFTDKKHIIESKYIKQLMNKKESGLNGLFFP